MFKRFFSKIFRIKSDKSASWECQNSKENDFRKITSKQIALENGIEYIEDAKSTRLDTSNKYVHHFYSKDGKYILLDPSKTEIPTVPIEWYFDFDGELKMIMDNQSSFKNISNLDKIISQIIKLYTKYIDEDVFISPESFAIKLENEVCPNYHGKAKLVLTKDSIRNDTINPNYLIEAKKYFLNTFLDHFFEWNFKELIESNLKLKKEFVNFNNLMVRKGLRERLD